MITIQQAVNQTLKNRPFIEESLNEGLINLTALARQLKPQIETVLSKPVQPGAIVMALKRYEPGKLSMIRHRVSDLVNKLSNIIVRSGISVHTFENSTTLPAHMAKLSVQLSKGKGLFYTFSQGVFETTIIIAEASEQILKKTLKAEKLQASSFNLSCITLYLPDENTEIPGYYYHILKLIASEGINIIEVLSTTNEFSLILEEKEVDRAFSVLKNAGSRR